MTDPRPSPSARNGSTPFATAAGCVVLGAGLIAGPICAYIAWRRGFEDRTLTIVGFGLVGLLVVWAGAHALRRWWTRRDSPLVARLHDLVGRSRGVAELARRLGEPADRLRAFAPVYREVRIPKRSGGSRTLHVPDDATKGLQQALLRRVLSTVPAHPAAYGFERRRSIAHHAAQHVGRGVVLRFDVVDFFPATRAGRVERMFLRLGWSREAAAVLTRLTTHRGGLPQGAPTSPRISNLVNTGFDRALAARVAHRHGRYSRYADDITVSFPEDWLGSVPAATAWVRDELRRRGYEMHERRKLSVRRRHQRQVVTGLVVNRKVALPRALRRKLRAVRHHLAVGRPATMTEAQVRGWEAFERMVRMHGAETPPPWTRSRRPQRTWKRYRP